MKDPHSRALELSGSPHGGLSGDDRSWLSQHLASCAECRRLHVALGALGAAIRLEPGEVPARVVARAKLAIRGRLLDRREAEASARAVVASLAVATMTTTASATLSWWAVAWLGRFAGLSGPACLLAYACLWTTASFLVALAGVAASVGLSPLACVSGVEGGSPCSASHPGPS